MAKTTQLSALHTACVVALLLPCLAFGAGNLENNRHKTKGEPQLLAYFLLADTIIPLDHGFDSPISTSLPTSPHTPPRGFSSSSAPSTVSRGTPNGGLANRPKEYDAYSAGPRMIIPLYPVSIDTTYRQARKLPREYNGFKIELVVADSLLPPNHELFQRHGNLSMEEIARNRYSYTLGNFPTAQDADRFLIDTVAERFPRARVIEYRSGKRLN